jgi:WD40 repeat protein
LSLGFHPNYQKNRPPGRTFSSFEHRRSQFYRTQTSEAVEMPLNKHTFRLFCCLVFHLVVCANYLAITAQERAVLFPIERNDRWGYIDRSGKIIVEPRFEYAEEFSEGLGAVKVDGRWGFVDGSGKLVIEASYSSARPFSEGLARVHVGGEKNSRLGQWGFIDRSGAVVIQPQFRDVGIAESVHDFHDGLAMIEVDFLKGFIDKQGNIVISPRFTYAYPFSEGLASVSERHGEKWGYIDKTGAWVIPPKFEWGSMFSEGLAPVSLQAVCGYIDRTGEMKLRPDFQTAETDCAVVWGSFDGGLSRWRVYDKFGFINKAGELVIKPQFDLTFNFSEGLAFVEKNGKYGFVDQTGRLVIEPQFYSAKDFRNGLARVVYARGSWGYINKDGEFVWKTDPPVLPVSEAGLQVGHSSHISSVEWSPQSDLLASTSSADGWLKIWSVKEGRLIWNIRKRELQSKPFLKSPDGKLLVSRRDERAYEIRDAQSQDLIWTITTASAERVKSPDGLMVAERGSYGNAAIKLFDARTNQLIRRIEGHPGNVSALAYSPDGQIVASGSGDRAIRFWNSATGAILKTLHGHTDVITSLAFSADGKTLVSASEDDTLRVWNVGDGSLVRSIAGFTSGVGGFSTAALSSDARIIATGGQNKIKVWDAATARQIAVLKTDEPHTYAGPHGIPMTICCGSPVRSVTFNQAGSLIASGHEDSTIKLWHANSYELINTFRGRSTDLRSVVFSPDGETIAAGYHNDKGLVELWSTRTGKLKATLATAYVRSVAFSPNGTMIATGHFIDDVKLWNVKTGQLIKSFRQPASMDDHVAFSPDGKFVVSGGNNQNVIVWDVRSGKLVWSAIPRRR